MQYVPMLHRGPRVDNHLEQKDRGSFVAMVRRINECACSRDAREDRINNLLARDRQRSGFDHIQTRTAVQTPSTHLCAHKCTHDSP